MDPISSRRNGSNKPLAKFACLFAGLLFALPCNAQQVTIKIAFNTIRSGMENWAQTIKAGLEKRAGNRVKIEIYPGGQLGTQPQVIGNAQIGAVEMAEMPPELLSGLEPRFDIFASPGLFDDIAHAHRALHDKAFVKEFWPILDGKQLKLIGFACESTSEYNATVPLKTLADFKGKKIRVLGSRLETEILRRLGATGVPMEFADTMPAFQQKAIDGVRAGIVVLVPFKFYTIAKHVLRTGESVICPVKFVSKRWYDGLPADLRTMILEEAAKADDSSIKWNIDLNDKLYAAWGEQGGTISDLSAAEKLELRRKLQTVGDDVFKDAPTVRAAYDALKAAAARTRK